MGLAGHHVSGRLLMGHDLRSVCSSFVARSIMSLVVDTKLSGGHVSWTRNHQNSIDHEPRENSVESTQTSRVSVASPGCTVVQEARQNRDQQQREAEREAEEVSMA